MPKPSSNLSNCYIPLPIPSETFRQHENKTPSTTSRARNEERSAHGLRRLVLQSGTVASATGSSIIECGQTVVHCQVMAPLSAASSHLPSHAQLSMDEGILLCNVKYAPLVAYPTATLLQGTVQSMDQSQMTTGRINSWIMNRETDLSSRLSAALAAAVPLRQYAKCAILVQITVLQDDGGILPACIAAATLALVDAAVEVYDVVTACEVAVMPDGALWADPTLEESNRARATVTLAVMPNWKEVTVWEQAGCLTAPQANQAMELCRDGCRTLHRFLREHWIQQIECNDTK